MVDEGHEAAPELEPKVEEEGEVDEEETTPLKLPLVSLFIVVSKVFLAYCIICNKFISIAVTKEQLDRELDMLSSGMGMDTMED